MEWVLELGPDPTVRLDRMDEVLFVPESSSRIFHPLDLGIEGFAGGIRNLMCGSHIHLPCAMKPGTPVFTT
jgi:hypothetical protein